MSSPAETSLPYLLERLPTQWSPLLAAFAAELVEQMGGVDSRAFFRLLGQRIARESGVASTDPSLDGWLAAANDWLGRHAWGQVSAREQGARLDVTVAPTPLNQAFGPQARVAGAIYEGLLAHWFDQAGASGLVLSQLAGPEAADGRLSFGLGLPATAAGQS